MFQLISVNAAYDDVIDLSKNDQRIFVVMNIARIFKPCKTPTKLRWLWNKNRWKLVAISVILQYHTRMKFYLMMILTTKELFFLSLWKSLTKQRVTFKIRFFKTNCILIISLCSKKIFQKGAFNYFAYEWIMCTYFRLPLSKPYFTSCIITGNWNFLVLLASYYDICYM